MKKRKEKNKREKLFYYSPRILGILIILFMALFSFDVFDMGYSFAEALVGFLIHSIPSLILVILIIYSWKHEYIGGVIWIIVGVLFSIYFRFFKNPGVFIITLPLIFIGILFIINSKRIKKRK
jgi:hypothetical protein